MHCMLMDLLHGFEVLSTTEETLYIAFCSHIFDLCLAKGLFALNAILIRFVVVRNYIHFLT